jgi:hypothetical protein
MAEPVALGVQTPDIFGKLSQLLSIRQQKQALQGQAAEVAGAQQSQKQRAALAKYDFGKHLAEDGTPDLNSLIADPELRAAAGDQFQDVISKAAAVKSQQLESKSKLVALRNDQREAFASMMNGLRSDRDVTEDNEQGRQKLNQAMVQYGEMYGEDVLPVLSAYAGQLQKVPKGKLGDALKSVGMQALSASQQLETQKPNYANVGASLQDVNPLTPAGQSPSNIPLSLSPGQRFGLTTNAAGQIVKTDLGAGTVNPVNAGAAPGGGVSPSAPMRPAANPNPSAAEASTMLNQADENFKNVTANRQAASLAPQQLDQIDKALNLSKDVSTGAWAAKRAEVESGLGSLIPGYQGVNDASKLQLLDKFAERIATDASKVLGVNATTDAQRESIHKQNANIGYTPQAVQDVLKYAKAQTMAMEAKGNAQERWLEQEGNSITKQHQFETKFRQAYDPRVFQFDAMSEDEQNRYLKGLSKEERKTLREKTRALIELGAIPGG